MCGHMKEEIKNQRVTGADWMDHLRNINHIDHKSDDHGRNTLCGLIEKYLELTGRGDTFYRAEYRTLFRVII